MRQWLSSLLLNHANQLLNGHVGGIQSARRCECEPREDRADGVMRAEEGRHVEDAWGHRGSSEGFAWAAQARDELRALRKDCGLLARAPGALRVEAL